MARRKKKLPDVQPTPAELEILSMLWAREAATVREVHEALAQRRDVGYTTTLKQMQVMAEKGLLTRDTGQRQHVYRPAAPRAATEKTLVRDLMDRVFGGNLQQMLLRALEDETTTTADLTELQRLLDDHKKRESRSKE